METHPTISATNKRRIPRIRLTNSIFRSSHSRHENQSRNKNGPGALTQACVLGATLLAAFLLVPVSARSQQPGETKIPTRLGKIKGGEDTQLAFTGKVQSVDLKLKLLSMTPEEGKNTEIFPIKKNTLIRTARGDRISVKELKAGTDVMIYYELKGTHRVIKRIIELSPRKNAEEKTPPSPS